MTTAGIVTATTGIFHPGRTFIEEPNGGPWSGILLWDSTETLYANEGDEVRITGQVYEYFGMTEILVNNYDILGTGNSLPPVELVSTGDIAPGSVTAESYEGVLVQVQNVTVIDDNLGFGEWLVDDGSGACRIDDDADKMVFEIPAIGTTLSSITGVLDYSYGSFKLEPRYRTDIIINAPNSTGDSNSLPISFKLEQNYPNPFNPTTTIKYSISQPSHVTIKVFDLLGREIAVLVNAAKMNGEYNIEFDASDLASGVYVYRMKAGNFSEWKKFVLLR